MSERDTSHHAQQHERPKSPSPAAYAWVLAVLMALLALTAGAHYLPIGPLGLIVAMLIAVTKAALVAAVFMHLRYESGVIRLFGLAGVFWLAILVCLTLADYLTRF